MPWPTLWHSASPRAQPFRYATGCAVVSGRARQGLAQPGGAGGDFLFHGGGHPGGERNVLVDRVHDEDAGLAVRLRVELADEFVADQDRQREVAPPSFRGGLVHLELVAEPE